MTNSGIWWVKKLIVKVRVTQGYMYNERVSTGIISSGKALYLELRPTMLELAMVFVVSNGDYFCSVR